MEISSPAFKPNADIPSLYTCEGKDLSPPLHFSDVPAGTKSLVLIVDDPDAPDPKAPKMVWIHWVLYNLPPDVTQLRENVEISQISGALSGQNSWKNTHYGGPCPPIGRHRYYHKLYALDTLLPDLKQPTVDKLKKEMQGHILAEAVLMGTYQKKK